MKDPYKKCRNCVRFKTIDCPNSSLCFALENKPFFMSKKKDNFITKIKNILTI